MFFTGVPSEILRGNGKYFNNEFVTTLCNFAHESMIYDHYLPQTNTPTSQWHQKLPMAL